MARLLDKTLVVYKGLYTESQVARAVKRFLEALTLHQNVPYVIRLTVDEVDSTEEEDEDDD